MHCGVRLGALDLAGLGWLPAASRCGHGAGMRPHRCPLTHHAYPSPPSPPPPSCCSSRLGSKVVLSKELDGAVIALGEVGRRGQMKESERLAFSQV